MESNIWFYTFSTAAQVMAALVGLFAVFVVYKVQEFSGELKEVREDVRDMLPYISGNTRDYRGIPRRDLITKNDTELLGLFRELLDVSKTPDRVTVGDPNFNEEEYKLYEHLILLRRDIFLDLREVLAIGFGVIGISILALIGTGSLFTLPGFVHELILWLFFLLFTISLIAMGKGVYRITIK